MADGGNNGVLNQEGNAVMKNRKDSVWTKYSRNAFGLRRGCQKAARAVRREFEDVLSLADMWNLKPVYVPGVVVRRRPR